MCLPKPFYVIKITQKGIQNKTQNTLTNSADTPLSSNCRKVSQSNKERFVLQIKPLLESGRGAVLPERETRYWLPPAVVTVTGPVSGPRLTRGQSG